MRNLSFFKASLILAPILTGLLAGFNSTHAQTADAAQQKARALLSEMTLEEKIGQMTQVDMNALKDKADIKRFFLGSVLSGGGSDPTNITAKGWASSVEEFQSWAFRTRLKIPLIYGVDAVHGHNNVDGAVVFPHNIGLGATRNPSLVEQAARVTARESAATGIRWAFAPCVAVARDARWGRTYESFGEQPELAELLGAAAVRGLQGASLAEPQSVLACAKHYLGDGGTINGIDQGNTVCDEATLRRIHLPGYVSAIKAGVGSIMVSYNSWNGAKLHGHRYLMTDLLKGELGFKGFLVSDWAAIDQLTNNYKAAIEKSINAGMDMAMIPAGPGEKNNYIDYIENLKALVAEKRVPMSRIDDAVLRILRVKQQMGLFEEPYADRRLLDDVGCQEHREVARACVRESLVLLKNSHGVLPVARKAKRIHLAGRGADDLGMQCGGWTIDWQGRMGPVTSGGTTMLAAFKKAVSEDTKVTYSPEGSGASGADVVIVVIGESPYAEMKGDSKDLALSAQDLAAVETAKGAGVPVVTVVFSGRPVILGRVLELSDALVAAWLPGTEGTGIVDVLLGDAAPKGKLPCTWPRSIEQVGKPDLAKEALFPYGFGLTYAKETARR